MASAPVVKRDRQKWHEAVENEILDQLPRRSTSVNQIVSAVLSRDPAYPPGPVRRYVEYILEIPIFMGDLKPANEEHLKNRLTHLWQDGFVNYRMFHDIRRRDEPG